LEFRLLINSLGFIVSTPDKLNGVFEFAGETYFYIKNNLARDYGFYFMNVNRDFIPAAGGMCSFFAGRYVNSNSPISLI